jgi:hypothetical protein
VSSKSFHLYDVEFGLCYSTEFWSSIRCDVSDYGEVRCYGLSKVWNGGEGYDLHGLWLVLIESAMDRFLGVDLLVQHVLPRI